MRSRSTGLNASKMLSLIIETITGVGNIKAAGGVPWSQGHSSEGCLFEEGCGKMKVRRQMWISR